MNLKAIRFTKHLLGRYPTTTAMVALYTFFALLNLALVIYEIMKLNRFHADIHTYCDHGVEILLGVFLVLVFGAQCALFIIGYVIGLSIDRRRLQQQASVKSPLRSNFHTASVIAIFLLLPAWGIYGSTTWSLFHDFAFQITASPQQKLDNDFVWNVLNRGYDKAKIKRYLDKGADLNLCGYHGTPLIMATQADDEEFVNELLSRGANVNAAFRRRTALSYALEGDSSLKKYSDRKRRIAIALLDHGAGPDVDEYDNPLNIAIRDHRDKELVEKILGAEGLLDPRAKEVFLDNALMRAAYAGNNMAVLLLLEHGANVNYRYRPDRNTPLTYAMSGGKLETARLLILHGADVNVQDQNGATPLMLAAKWRRPELFDLLLKSGASVSERDHNWSTALTYAASLGDVQRVKKLMALCTNEDLDGTSGANALAAAIDANSPELVKLFIDAGVDVNHGYDPGGGSLLKKATTYNTHTRPEIIRLLREAGAQE